MLFLLLSCKSDLKEPSSNVTDQEEQIEDQPADVPEDCLTLEELYVSQLEGIVEGACVGCHVSGGLASETRLVLSPGSTSQNIQALSEVATITENEGFLLWLKPTGQHVAGHVGGELIPKDSAEAEALALFIGRANGTVDECAEAFDPTQVQIDCELEPPGRRLLRRLSHVEYDNTIRDLFGIESNWGASFAPDNVVHGYNNNATGLQVSSLLADQYMNAAEEVANQVIHAQAELIIPCGILERSVNCAEDFLLQQGGRIFRRPLNSAEMAFYLGFFEDIYYEDGFNEALEWTLAALLQSPHFLYRSELGQAGASGSFELTSWELATELSYLIWQTTPDDALLELAANGSLLDREVLHQQVEQMLLDPRATQTISNLSEQWLSLNLLPIVPREGDYDVFTDELRTDMGLEIDKFIQGAFLENLTLSDLFLAEYSYMTQDLAHFYGVSFNTDSIDSDGFARVDLSSDHRYGGLLTQGALLTVHALPSSSSPIHRGLLIRERLLCQELPLPPANLDTSPPAMDPNLSTRERYEAHSVDPACAGCHNLIDPLGFGLEHYDGIGRWRDLDGVHQIDASGVIAGVAQENVSFDGAQELSARLSEQEEVAQCYVQQWFTFGFGEGDLHDSSISCGVEDAFGQYEELGGGLQSPLLGLTQTDRFYERVGGATEGETFAVDSDYTEIDPPDTDLPGGTSSELDVYVLQDSNWGTGYCNTVTVTNLTENDIVWEVTLEVPGVIFSLWSAESSSGQGLDMVFTGVSWNETLGPGGMTSFGFCAEYQ
ncbi:MAG: hypothetical protein CMK59_06685 [Proteobacteria bacterium]|nr:hypothetical protein [Pseudomonadota bacterium]